MSNNPIDETLQNLDAIKADESANEFLVPAIGGTLIPVPYSHLENHKAQRDALIRLIRKNVSHDMIEAFIEKAKAQNKWHD